MNGSPCSPPFSILMQISWLCNSTNLLAGYASPYSLSRISASRWPTRNETSDPTLPNTASLISGRNWSVY